MEHSHPPAVFVIDDDKAILDCIAILFQSVSIPCEGYLSAEEFLRVFDRTRPGCVVADVRMPGMSGLELLAELAARKSQIPVILISGYADVPMAVSAMKTGAFYFFQKPFQPQDLLDQVQAAIRKDAADREQIRRYEEVQHKAGLLSPREREIFHLIGRGRTNKEVAATIGLKIKTVEFHRGHVMMKMQAATLSDLIQMHILATSNWGKP